MNVPSDKATAAACVRQDCGGCEIQGKLLCIHTLKDLIDFYVLFIGWAIPGLRKKSNRSYKIFQRFF
jgi:hypothetical protein